MWIIVWLSYVMFNFIFIAIEYIISSTSYVDSINKTIFAEGVSEIPKGFFVAGSDIIELVPNTPYGATFYFAMQIETGGDGAIADEDELAEEGAAAILNEVFDLFAPGDADDAVVAQHGHITQTVVVTLTFFGTVFDIRHLLPFFVFRTFHSPP